MGREEELAKRLTAVTMETMITYKGSTACCVPTMENSHTCHH